MSHIHNIARGLCVKNGAVLLAWHKVQQYYFLPGGHVETGESSAAALVREFMEELGIAVTCGDFLVLFEHAWKNGELIQHELTSVFMVDDVNPNAPVQSRIEHLEFKWVPLTELSAVKFLPSELKETIMDAAAGRSTPHFLSTMR
ncbi:MAG: NUDIX domain-containing protein [Patescibacteria group bacterium]|jgi:8-oxo-dGTP pyrophosphatase MutT (NUDIX family)